MLVLTRRPGENIRIGQDIVITVLKVAPGQVKIGIEAPPDVIVHREEIYERIQEANRKAAGVSPEGPTGDVDALQNRKKPNPPGE